MGFTGLAFYPGSMLASSIRDWWLAVRLLSDDPYVRLAAGAAAGGLALAAVGTHSLILWRRERSFVARELHELLDRWHSYDMGTFATDSEQRQELARYVVAAWLTPRLERYSDTQLFILARLVDGLEGRPVHDKFLVEHLRAELAEPVSMRLGTAHSPAVLKMLDHGIQKLFRIAPPPPELPPLRPSDKDAPDPAPVVQRLVTRYAGKIAESEPHARRLAERYGREWLDAALTSAERSNAVQDWPDGFSAPETAAIELILWKLHEEMAGPHPRPESLRLLSKIRAELPPALRSVPIAEAVAEGNELRVTFLRNPWLHKVVELRWRTDLVIESGGATWHMPRLELTGDDAALVFQRRPENALSVIGAKLRGLRFASVRS